MTVPTRENNAANRSEGPLPKNDRRQLNDGGVKRPTGRDPIHHNDFSPDHFTKTSVDLQADKTTYLLRLVVFGMKLFLLQVRPDVSICL